ncbi:MAG: V-type ATPase subunit [Candidatus Izemoplasmatales bacterium]
MSKWASNAIITKAKAIYGRRLTPLDYTELTKKNTVGDVAEYLKNSKKFKEILQDIQENSIHRGQLEELIKKANFNYVIRLIKFIDSSDKGFFEMNIIRRETDILLTAAHSVISGEYQLAIAELPIYFVRHASFDILELSKARSFQNLLEVIKDTPYYQILLPFTNMPKEELNHAILERAFQEYYYDTVFARIEKLYKGKILKDLRNIFLTNIELLNIVKIYRMKKFYHAPNNVIEDSLLLKYSRISRNKMLDLMSLANPDDILKNMHSSEYKEYIDEDDYVYIEYLADHLKYNLAKRFMNFSYDAPTVFAAYVILSEIEQQNIFNIIEGIRYDLEELEIKKMLIY